MQVPKFEPGRARYNMAVTDDVLNVLPAADGYKPLPGPKAFIPAFEILSDAGDDGLLGTEDDALIVTGPGGAALSGEIQLPGTLGGIYVKTADGTQVIIVGTQTGLYKLATDNTWVEISGASAPYSVGVEKRWSFALFGTTILAQNFSDPEQKYDIITDSVFSDNTTAPRCAYISVFGSFVIRGCLIDDKTAVQWSAPENFASNEAGIDNSDIQPIPEGGVVQAIIPMSYGFDVLMRDTRHIMSFAPDSGLVFKRTPIDGSKGCIAPYSVAKIGVDDYVFYAQDGFTRVNGAGATMIGEERFDPWFQETIDYSARVAMVAGIDFRRRVLWQRVLMADGSYRLFGYRWSQDAWTQSNADLADMFQAETYGITIDEMDNFFATIDDVDVPYDSSFWDGGAPDLAGMTSDGLLAYMNGEPMAARISTNDIAFNGMKRAFVNGGRAVTDAVNFTAQLSSANYRGASFTAKNPVSPTSRSRFLSLRGDGQVHRVLFEIPAGEDWSTFNEFEINAVPSGGS